MKQPKPYHRVRRDGRHEVRIRLPTSDGKPTLKSFYGKTEDEAIKKLSEFVEGSEAQKKKEARILSAEEQTYFIQAAKANKYGVIFMAQLYVGARIGEILALTFSDVDFDAREITISSSLGYKKSQNEDKYILHVSKTKNKKSRTVPLCDAAVELLNELREKSDNESVFAINNGRIPCRKTLDNALINIKMEMERLNSKAIPPFTSHSLRHTFATRAMEHGVPIKIISEWLGHSSIKITGDTYFHVLNKTEENSRHILYKIFK